MALLAWLPFLAALVLAFAAGVLFARINESLVTGGSSSSSEPLRRGGLSRFYRGDFVLTTVLVALILAVVFVWLGALVTALHHRH